MTDCPMMTEWTSALVQKFSYWKLIRCTALVKRFLNNCRQKEKNIGPVATDEIESAESTWLRVLQGNQLLNSHMELGKYNMGVWRCYGRVPDYNPAFISRESILAVRILGHCHKTTLHGEHKQ